MEEKIEIERKFLLAKVPSPQFLQGFRRQHIIQLYNGDSRYRQTFEGKDFSYEHIKKEFLRPAVNREFIEKSSYDEFVSKLKEVGKHLSKIRYKIESGEHLLELDVFDDLKICVCEVELKSLEDKIYFPTEIQDLILMEVTDNRLFSNKHLFSLI